MEELIFIKLGGSVITKPSPYTPDIERIDLLLKEIKDSMNDKKVIIGHGGGSFPHIPAKEYQVNLGLVNEKSRYGASLTQHAAAQLHRIVFDEMLKIGFEPISFPPSAGVITKKGKIINWNIEPIKLALSKGFSIVTYGDLGIDEDQGVSIVSTEEAFRYLANELRPSKVILIGDVDGVFDKDPNKFKDANLIKEINKDNINSVLNLTSGSAKIADVTGGMKTKLSILYDIVISTGAIGYIANGSRQGVIKNILEDKDDIYTKVVK